MSGAESLGTASMRNPTSCGGRSLIEIDEDIFREYVYEALSGLPTHLRREMSNVEVIVADENADDTDMLGLYEGVPLTERGDSYHGALPDRIYIYRVPLCRMCETIFELVEEVQITVVHEVAHHFGIDDDALDEWGWG